MGFEGEGRHNDEISKIPCLANYFVVDFGHV